MPGPLMYVSGRIAEFFQPDCTGTLFLVGQFNDVRLDQFCLDTFGAQGLAQARRAQTSGLAAQIAFGKPDVGLQSITGERIQHSIDFFRCAMCGQLSGQFGARVFAPGQQPDRALVQRSLTRLRRVRQER